MSWLEQQPERMKMRAERDYLGAKLQAIWEDQRAFNLLLRQPPKSDEELTDQARDFVLWTESELHELLRVLPWKKHRRLPMRNNHAHLEEEGVDVLKYVLSILQLIGFETLDQVVDAYWRKTAVVRQRYREEWTSKIDRPCVICDIDNVLCDYISGMITWLADHDLIAPANVERLRAERPFMNAEAVGVPNDLWQRWKHRFRVEGAKRKLPVFDDARDFLRRMKDRGQQVVLLTSRPIDQYPNIFTDTILWLNENDLPYDFVWWSLDKAERVMQIEGFRQHVQFAVDDDRRYVDQFASVGIPTFWLQRNGPQSSRVNLMVAQVNSLQEIV